MNQLDKVNLFVKARLRLMESFVHLRLFATTFVAEATTTITPNKVN